MTATTHRQLTNCPGLRGWLLFMVLCCAVLPVRTTWARQYLIAPGSDWEHLDSQIKPGDEIILMPGRHQHARLWNAQGTPEQPIVIRALDADHVVFIDADRHGIRLHRPRHVTIQDIEIVGAMVGGIRLDDTIGPGTSATERENTESPGHVTVRRCAVRKVGPVGRRNAIEAIGLTKLKVLNCDVEGWGGSAVEIVACRNVRIDSCTFLGLPDHGQLDGIRARAGSDYVTVERCRFEGVVGQCFVLGTKSKPEEFRPPLTEDMEDGTRFEAIRALVQQCVMIRCGVALSMTACDSCTVRGNTIVNPSRHVLALSGRADDTRFGATRGTIFGENLIVWEPGALKHLGIVNDNADASGLRIGENLWWSSEPAEARAELGDPPGELAYPQVVDVDPQLDDTHHPATKAALAFGEQRLAPPGTATVNVDVNVEDGD